MHVGNISADIQKHRTLLDSVEKTLTGAPLSSHNIVINHSMVHHHSSVTFLVLMKPDVL